jgi:hypothetical protein
MSLFQLQVGVINSEESIVYIDFNQTILAFQALPKFSFPIEGDLLHN